MHDSIQSIGSQVRWKDGDRQVLVRFVWKPPLHRQGLAQKASTSLPEKLTEKDPCCKACPALCARHRGKEWEALLGYGDAALGCDGRVRDVLGAGGLGSGRGGQLASVARVTGQQILREVRLKLVLLFTDPITKCRPSVFLGFFMWFVLYCAHHCARGTEVFLLSFLRYQGVQIVSVTLRVWVRPVQQHRVQHRFSVVPCCAAFEAEKVFVLFLWINVQLFPCCSKHVCT